jgi:hypothetical protein
LEKISEMNGTASRQAVESSRLWEDVRLNICMSQRRDVCLGSMAIGLCCKCLHHFWVTVSWYYCIWPLLKGGISRQLSCLLYQAVLPELSKFIVSLLSEIVILSDPQGLQCVKRITGRVIHGNCI